MRQIFLGHYYRPTNIGIGNIGTHIGKKYQQYRYRQKSISVDP